MNKQIMHAVITDDLDMNPGLVLVYTIDNLLLRVKKVCGTKKN
jgi:hypothetical protein